MGDRLGTPRVVDRTFSFAFIIGLSTLFWPGKRRRTGLHSLVFYKPQPSLFVQTQLLIDFGGTYNFGENKLKKQMAVPFASS